MRRSDKSLIFGFPQLWTVAFMTLSLCWIDTLLSTALASLLTAPMTLTEIMASLSSSRKMLDERFSTSLLSLTDRLGLGLGLGLVDIQRLFLSLFLIGADAFFFRAHPWPPLRFNECHGNKANADIAGMGVRGSTYVTLFAVFASLAIGSFHRSYSGTKELGVATMCNQLVMALNLLKSRDGILSPTDVFITVIMLDVHAVALSATLSCKEALASRWYVGLTLLVQCFAWAAVTYAIVRSTNQAFYDPDSFCCLQGDWFKSRFDTCHASDYISSFRSAFAAYWAVHTFDTVQSLALALLHTAKFDTLEKIDRTHRNGNDTKVTAYSSLPSTAFSNWLGFALYPCMLVIAIEGHLSKYHIPVPGWGEWGQTTTLVTCVCGVGHWLWVNLHHCWHFLKSKRDQTAAAATPSDHGRMLPVNVSRLVAMGAKPPLVAVEDVKLLATGLSE